MNIIGFSTGALAYGDFRRGLEMQSGRGLGAVELSALRDTELVPLIEAIGELDLSAFEYVSFHAPSRVSTLSESQIVEILSRRVPESWPIVLHPDVIEDPATWRILGSRICLENMDQRKPIGRTAAELAHVYESLPEARLCLDLGHARQVDPTMSICYHLIETFRDKIVQIHVSEVNDESRHVGMNAATIAGIRRISRHLPDCPWIIESVLGRPGHVAAEVIDREIDRVKRCLHAPLCLPMMSLVD